METFDQQRPAEDFKIEDWNTTREQLDEVYDLLQDKSAFIFKNANTASSSDRLDMPQFVVKEDVTEFVVNLSIQKAGKEYSVALRPKFSDKKKVLRFQSAILTYNVTAFARNDFKCLLSEYLAFRVLELEDCE